MKIIRVFSIMFILVRHGTRILVTDAKQEKLQSNAQSQKVAESVSYFLLKVDIKDKDFFLKVKQKKNIALLMIK